MCIRDRWTAEQIASKLRVAADDIDNTTKKWIRDAESRIVEEQLAQGIVEGATRGTLSKAIEHVTDGKIGRNRAKVIARTELGLSLIHISEPTRLLSISYAVFCL